MCKNISPLASDVENDSNRLFLGRRGSLTEKGIVQLITKSAYQTPGVGRFTTSCPTALLVNFMLHRSVMNTL